MPGEIKYLPARNEVQHAYADHTLAKSVFPHHKNTQLREGLLRMAEWAKKEGVKKSQDFDPIEIKENLPPSWLS
jgi:UDP-glucose 4-epimerase